MTRGRGFANSREVPDTVPRESLARWLVYLRRSYTVLPFSVSSAFMPSEAPNKKAKPIPKDDTLGLGGLWTHLDNFARPKNSEELIVAVTGVTNVSVNCLDPKFTS